MVQQEDQFWHEERNNRCQTGVPQCEQSWTNWTWNSNRPNLINCNVKLEPSTRLLSLKKLASWSRKFIPVVAQRIRNGYERMMWLAVAGSRPDENKTFSILSKFTELVYSLPHYRVIWADLQYTRQGHWELYDLTLFVRLGGGREHKVSVFCRWQRHIILWGLIMQPVPTGSLVG